jgi:ubiquinone/menaquinone biosynthesis C-methylase UbiE
MTYNDTINWSQYWSEADEKDIANASPSADFVIDALLEFLTETSTPHSYADVGCGAGTVVFTLADQYPEMAVTGYDAVESVLQANRQRALEAGLKNVCFELAPLPLFQPEQSFDVVSCFYTLCYVANSERALQELYDAVAPGGYLVLTYHN